MFTFYAPGTLSAWLKAQRSATEDANVRLDSVPGGLTGGLFDLGEHPHAGRQRQTGTAISESLDRAGAAMNGYHAFGCDSTIANINPTFRGGLWTVTCPKCGVISKLQPDASHKGTFTVVGAFFNTRKAPAAQTGMALQEA
jgi:hypothetical protein